MAMRDRVLDELSKLVDIEAAGGTRRPGAGDPAARPRAPLEGRACRSPSSSRPRARTRRRSSTGCGREPPGRCSPTSRSERSSSRRRSRRATRSSRPRSSGWRSGPARKPQKVRTDLDRRGLLEAVRSDIARGKALEFVVDAAVALDSTGAEIDVSIPTRRRKSRIRSPRDRSSRHHRPPQRSPKRDAAGVQLVLRPRGLGEDPVRRRADDEPARQAPEGAHHPARHRRSTSTSPT